MSSLAEVSAFRLDICCAGLGRCTFLSYLAYHLVIAAASQRCLQHSFVVTPVQAFHMTWVSGSVGWHCNFPLSRKDASLLKPHFTKVTDLLERFQHLLLHEFQIMSRHLTILGTWQCSMPDDQGLLPVLRCEDFIVGGSKAIYSLSHPVWINKCDFSRNHLTREFSRSFSLISMLKYKSSRAPTSGLARYGWGDGCPARLSETAMPWAPYWLRDGWLLLLYDTKWQCWGVMWRMQLRQMRLQRGTFRGKVRFFSSFFHWQGRQPLHNYEAWLSTFRKAIEKEEYQPEHDDREEALAFSLCSARQMSQQIHE